jgi:hypothetical protein
MNDTISLIATGALMLFFFICGAIDILDNLVIKVLLFGGYIAIIINIILVKSKEDDEEEDLI